MAEIRKATKSDLERVEYICRQTAGEGARTNEIMGKTTALTYSTYYITEDADSCFVLDDGKEAVGYILCAPDAKRFTKIFRKKYVPEIYKLEKRSGITAWVIPIPYMILRRKYSAHLHIDLLPQYQRGGYGTKLVNTLIEELKRKNVNGVILCVDGDNTGAIKFYEKNGFKTVVKFTKFRIMGMKLKDEQ